MTPGAVGDFDGSYGVAGGGGGGGGSQGSPDIYLIITDDLKEVEDAPGYLRDRFETMFRDKGWWCPGLMAAWSVCGMSRSAIFSGVHQHRGNYDGGGFGVTLDKDEFIFRWLSGDVPNRTYQTAWLGKIINNYNCTAGKKGDFPPFKGVDHWRGLAHDYLHYYDWESYEADFDASWNLVSDRLITDTAKTSTTYPGGYYTTDYLRDEMQNVLDLMTSRPADDVRKDLPIFMVITPIAPHTQTSTPPAAAGSIRDQRNKAYNTWVAPYADSTKPAAIDREDAYSRVARFPNINTSDPNCSAMINGSARGRMRTMVAVDDLLEALILKLHELGRIENSIIIMTSDNGFQRGENAPTPSVTADWGGKDTIEDAGNLTGITIMGKGIPVGVRSNLQISNIDIPPTIAAFAGVEPLYEVDGIDFSGMLMTPDALDGRVMLMQGGTTGDQMDGVRTKRWKYVRQNSTGSQPQGLWDRLLDPWETTNLVNGDHSYIPTGQSRTVAEIITDLDEKVGSMLECSGESCRVTDYTG